MKTSFSLFALLLLSACAVSPSDVTTARASIEQTPIPTERIALLPDASPASLPPVSAAQAAGISTAPLVPAMDVRGVALCDAAYIAAEVLGIPVSCSGAATVDLVFPDMPKHLFADAILSALRGVATVTTSAGGWSVVGPAVEEEGASLISASLALPEGPTSLVEGAQSSALPDTILIPGVDPEAIQRLSDAFGLDLVPVVDPAGVRVVGAASSVAFAKNFYADRERVSFVQYAPGMADSWSTIAALYPEGVAYDAARSLLHVSTDRATAERLVASIGAYLAPQRQVRVTAYLVESRDDLASRLGLTVQQSAPGLGDGGAVSLLSGIGPVLRALDSTSGTSVLSQPSMTVRDGSLGRVQVGDSVPLTTTTVSDGVAVESVQYLDTGVILEVTPDVRPDGSVALDLRVETSSASDGQGGAPRISRRSASSSLHMSDGDTIAISGLRSASASRLAEGVPGLTSIGAGGESRSTVGESYLTILVHVDVM